jgi:hypothetical protein
MKSIKEKAEDNCIKYGSLGDIAYSEFVEGANYVLEEIERCVKSSSNSRLKIDTIKQIIEQLKSNQ